MILPGTPNAHIPLSAQLSGIYPKISAEEQFDIEDIKKAVEKAIRKIWLDEGFDGNVNEFLTEFFASKYWKGVEEGYGQKLSDLDFDTPDRLFLEKLKEDVWQFSAAKNYQQLKAMSDALLDESGMLRSFTEFRNAAMQIVNDHRRWLRAEYNFAVASSQMSAKWQRIEQTKEDLPLLQYETVGDDRVRPAHQELEGVTLPVDDPFWDLYYPPNGWNCRCDVRQLSSGKITPKERIITPEKMPDLFKLNFGKQKIVFPPDHPYYIDLPDSVKKKADKLRKKND